MQRKMEESDNKTEESMYEEMRAREAIKRNVILHGVRNPDSKTDKERMEADISECEKIFKATKASAKRRDIRFCRRIGEKGQEKRPLLVGMTSELIKTELLDSARELQHSSIGPDQTRKQRQAEKKLAEVAEKKNREELTAEDVSNNLKWTAVGRKGEKNCEGTARENTWGESSNSQPLGQGRGRGGARTTWKRTIDEKMDLDEGTQKRTRGRGGDESESEEETDNELPRNRPRQ
jgi:hypothetical protein